MDRRGRTIIASHPEKSLDHLATIRCLRHCIAPNDRELSTSKETVSVEIWEVLVSRF